MGSNSQVNLLLILFQLLKHVLIICMRKIAVRYKNDIGLAFTKIIKKDIH